MVSTSRHSRHTHVVCGADAAPGSCAPIWRQCIRAHGQCGPTCVHLLRSQPQGYIASRTQADVRRVFPLDPLLLLPPVARPAYPSAALPARDPERGVCDEQNEDLPERPAAVDPEHRLRICGERSVSSVEEHAVPQDRGRIQILLQYRLPREVEPRVEKRKGGGVDSRVCKQDGKCNARTREQEEDGRDVLR